MKSISEHLRSHILQRCGVEDPEGLDLDELYRREWSLRFEQLMRNRLVMGAVRYGALYDVTKPYWNNVLSAQNHLDLYLRTGNQEHLVDAANLCMAEFCRPSCHASPRFEAMDDVDHHTTLK